MGDSDTDFRLQDEDDDEEDEEEERKEAQEHDTLLRRMLRTRSIVISQDITPEVTRRVIQQLILLDADDPKAEIKVYINSPGGDADSGFAIFDMLRFVRAPIKTICAGLVASAGSIILLAAERQNRISLPNARIMIHQPRSIIRGSSVDIQITAKEIVKLRERADRLIAQETGKPVERVTEDTDRDYWMSPAEALEYGLISRIVTRMDEIA